jgi:hypothetical protein
MTKNEMARVPKTEQEKDNCLYHIVFAYPVPNDRARGLLRRTALDFLPPQWAFLIVLVNFGFGF